MNMQSQGHVEYLQYQLPVGFNTKAGFWIIEMMTETQYRQNNTEPLNTI